MAAALGDPLADAIGRSYDAVPYDGGAQAGLGLAQLRGAAAVLGLGPSPGPVIDVLDVGCGAGAQLFAAAQQSAGRMVGIDASAQACAVARGRGAALGERWRILHGDASVLDPSVLGRFDVIYVIGTAYIMPAAARARMLAGVAACLKPGGVVVMNYYTGLVGLARTRLGAILRNQNDMAWPIERQVATARANLKMITDMVPAEGVAREVVTSSLAGMGRSNDTVLFHEALGLVFDTLLTGDIEGVLAGGGVSFLNYLPPAPIQAGAPSRAAAGAADAWDFATGGGYRMALFGRGAVAKGVGVRHPDVVWATTLRSSLAADGGVVFSDPGRGVSIQTSGVAMRAVLECLIAAPLGWAGLGAAARGWLGVRGFAVPEGGVLEAAMEQVFWALWPTLAVWPSLGAVSEV